MYREHAGYVQGCVAAGGFPILLNVQRFVLGTIRFPLWQAALATRAHITGEGDVEAATRQLLWGSKGRGYAYLDTGDGHCSALDAMEYAKAGKYNAALRIIARTPGLGLVKAGFVMQLAFGEFGCLDTHNLRLYGIDAPSFGGVKLDGDAARRKTAAYRHLCGKLGGAEELWNRWCGHVADTQPKRYANADAVSWWHVYGCGLGG